MQYICYKEKRFNDRSESLIATADSIIKEYRKQGYVLTLRQLYYQFVARNIIPNTEKSYKALGNLVTDARVAGRLPWDGIEDRAREHHMPYSNDDMQSIFHGLDSLFIVDPWARQDAYVEVWVEKEALGNVIERPCLDLRVPYMACKGYLSASQAWRAGQRFEEAHDLGKQCVLIHLGDHDPSGIDMTRDNKERLFMFSADSPVHVERIALNMDQVTQYAPPPNPTKITDSRAADYIRRFGDTSWELDALEPRIIERLIRDTIEQYRDPDVWAEDMEREEDARAHLLKYHEHYETINEFVRNL